MTLTYLEKEEVDHSHRPLDRTSSVNSLENSLLGGQSSDSYSQRSGDLASECETNSSDNDLVSEKLTPEPDLKRENSNSFCKRFSAIKYTRTQQQNEPMLPTMNKDRCRQETTKQNEPMFSMRTDRCNEDETVQQNKLMLPIITDRCSPTIQSELIKYSESTQGFSHNLRCTDPPTSHCNQNLQEDTTASAATKWVSSEGAAADRGRCYSSSTDGGWAWLVLAAGFLQFMVSSGIFYSWGVFFVPLLDTFNQSRANTAWVFSTNAAVHQLAGPLGGFLIPKLGPRLTIVLGGVFAASGCIMSAYAPSLMVMYFTHGVINAIGTSLNFTGWVVAISMFFVKRRSLALGMAMSGSGWGVLVLGPVLANVVPEIGWRKSMLMCAGLSLNFCLFGAFVYKNKIDKDEKKDTCLSYDKNIEYASMPDSNTHVEYNNGLKNLSIISTESMQISQSESSCKLHEKNILEENENLNKEGLWSFNTRFTKEKIQWLGVQITCVLSIMATSTVFTLLKDWILWINLDEITPYALIAIGVGDIIGRISAGLLSWKFKKQNSILVLFGGTQMLLAGSLALAAVSTTAASVLSSALGIGAASGLQCVFTATVPMKDCSAKDLGVLLLLGGVGALIGPPFAGFLVDSLQNYSTVLMFCSLSPILGVIACISCYFIVSKCFSNSKS